MRAALRTAGLGLALLLGGCASQAPLPVAAPALSLPLELHLQRQQDGRTQDLLLVIQADDAGSRWTLLDPLGIPQARQRLLDGHWQAEGLLPPNPQARPLFAALIFALTPAERLARDYPAARQLSSQNRQLPVAGGYWRVRYGAEGRFELDMPEGLTYGVAPLSNGADQ